MRNRLPLLTLLLCLCFTSSYAHTPKLDGLKAVIFDMDGVLRVGDTPVQGAGDLVSWMDKNGLQGMILTNECRYTPEKIRQDLHEMGVKLPKDWPIYTAAMAVRDFLRDNYTHAKHLHTYVIGENGLQTAIKDLESPKLTVCKELPQVRGQADELMLVIGAVNKIRIEDLEKAFTWITHGAKVITTCPDAADPAAKGNKLIGMPGHLVHMIKHQAPCSPYSLGKPHPFMIASAMELLRERSPTLAKSEVLFVGDSMDTDIRIAFEAQIQSALVLTGNTRLETVPNQICRPSFIFATPADLLARLEKLATKGKLGRALALGE